jgi:hypothetical protein
MNVNRRHKVVKMCFTLFVHFLIIVAGLFFTLATNVFGYGFVAEKSAGHFRRKPKIANLRGLSDRKVRSNEL